MKLSYSKQSLLNRESNNLLRKADNLLKKSRPKFTRRQAFAELKNRLMFSHLTEKDFFWDSIKKEFRHRRYHKQFLFNLDKIIKNQKKTRLLKKQNGKREIK